MRQAGLFDEVRVEDDPFVVGMVDRFGGVITRVSERPGDQFVWIETLHPPAQRRRYTGPLGKGGVPVPEKLDEVVKLGKYGGYEKPKPRGQVNPWRLVWSESRAPLVVGLFDSELSATNYRRKR